jgi:hypothetical protein
LQTRLRMASTLGATAVGENSSSWIRFEKNKRMFVKVHGVHALKVHVIDLISKGVCRGTFFARVP